MLSRKEAILRDISFYYQHQQDFRNNYSGRYILIKNKKVIDTFCTWQEASFKGLQLLGEDSFFVKRCS